MNTNRIRGGLYTITNGNQHIGTIRGDYKAGFWGYDAAGFKLPQTFDSIRDAAKSVARAHARRMGLAA